MLCYKSSLLSFQRCIWYFIIKLLNMWSQMVHLAFIEEVYVVERGSYDGKALVERLSERHVASHRLERALKNASTKS